MQRIAIMLIFFLIFLTPVSADPPRGEPYFSNPDEKAKFWSSLEHFYRCSIYAEANSLTATQAETCLAHFLVVKLSFVQGMNSSAFAELSSAERAEANRISYTKFKQWEAESQLSARRVLEGAGLQRLSLK